MGDASMVGATGCVAHLASSARASASVRVAFQRLQARCIRWQLLRSYCEPPRARGMSSSTTAARGSRWCRLWSTHSPQSAQWVSSALTRLTVCRLRWPLALTFPMLHRSPARSVAGAYDADIAGDMARVTYTFDLAAINQDSEPWVRESGVWRQDDC